MDNIGRWLEQHGLGKYTELFVENEIDFDVLGQITLDELKELGIPLGARKRILNAVSTLAEVGDPSSNADAPIQPTAGEAERRHLTILFADLVDSTQLSRQLELEHLREVNRSYQGAAKVAIESFGGYVARYMGDGVLAYFGYPQAHEDDAERAVRSGLALIDAVGGLAAPVTLGVRVGIATGPVVVGDIVGEGASQESAVVGETPNLAARLQSIAQPNTVQISDSTRSLVGDLFSCEDLGQQELRGFDSQPRVWRVLSEKSTASRFDALRSTNRSSFVGRNSELALLMERWETAASGEGQVVLLEGEPGIGKSRLAEELRQGAASHSHSAVRYQCSPNQTNVAFGPFVHQLQLACGFLPSDAPDARLDKLETTLPAETPERTNILSLFATLLSLPADRYPELNLEPQALKVAVINAICDVLASLSRRVPVLVLFEDAHWIDPTSQEILDALVERIPSLPVLLLVTHRPEFQSPWDAYGCVTQLRLNRLARKDGAALIREIAGGSVLSETVAGQILEKADGVALFVEELTKSVLESYPVAMNDAARTTSQEPSELMLPATLHDSLMARLDRLGGEKDIAQIAACIGREFALDLLQDVAERPESELAKALEELVESQLIFKRGGSAQTSYIFKHALVQDVAYESLLRSRRREIHASLVEALEARHSSNPNEVIELLAYHAQLAELWLPARCFLTKAGDKALARSAVREAITYYQQAVIVSDRFPHSPENAAQVIELKLALRQCYYLVGEVSNVMNCLRDAQALAEMLPDGTQQARILISLSGALRMTGDSRAALEYALEALKTSSVKSDPWLTSGANFYLGSSYWAQADYQEAEVTLRRSIEVAPDHRSPDLPGTTGHPDIQSHSILSWMLGELGRFEEGISLGLHSIHKSDEVGHAFDQTWARWGLANLYSVKGDYARALEFVEEASEISGRAHLDLWPTFVGWTRGYLLVQMGHHAEGSNLIEEAYKERARGDVRWGHALFTAHLGEGLLRAGRIQDAESTAKSALEMAQKWGERGREAVALRLLGNVIAKMGDSRIVEAEARLKEAERLARSLGLGPLQAQCHYDLGGLFRDRGYDDLASKEFAASRSLYESLGMESHPAKFRRGN